MELLLLVLLGCPYVGTPGNDRIQDVDDDGLIAIRFGGRDCDDGNPEVGDCDLDQDGFASTGFGGDDCDDTSTAVAPGQIEICDGLDNDCDGLTDDQDPDVSDPRPFFADDDGDGFGAGAAVFACEAPAGHVERDDDCNDDFASVHPGEPEQCDGIDWNCDGDPLEGAFQQWFADADGDTYGDPATLVAEGCTQPAGTVDNPHDCNDNDGNAHPIGLVNPDFTERCDGIDNDCDQLIDADDPGLDPTGAFLLFPDFDGDGFGDPLGGDLRCALDPDYVDNDLDCDDTDPLARPSAPPTLDYVEICDGFDNDCNGLTDTEDPNLAADSAFLLSPDADGDSFGDASLPVVVSCEPLAGLVADQSDCNDGDADIRPLGGERCATADDDDCDGLLGSDDPDNDGAIWYPDLDQDGVGVASGALPLCEPGGLLGFSTLDGDCDDNNPAVADDVRWYIDLDGDGWADASASDFIESCAPILGRTILVGDCDDANSTISPSAAELCNDEDDNCNGLVDDGAPGSGIGYEDQDGDGFGAGPQGAFCVGVSPNNLDCDDGNPTVAPFSPEFCDGIDNDCDGLIDEEDPDVVLDVYYPDDDLDGFGDSAFALETCAPPPGYIREGSDCDPTNPARYFSTFYVESVPDQDDPTQVTTLQQALSHPGACPDDIEVVLRTDAFLVNTLNVTGRLEIRGDDPTSRPTFSLFGGAGLIVSGSLTLEGVGLDIAGPRPSGGIEASGMGAGSGLALRDVSVVGDVDGPLLGIGFQNFGEVVDVQLDGIELGAITLDGLVRAEGVGGNLVVRGVVADQTTFESPIVDFASLPFGENHVDFTDNTLSDITMPTGAGPMIWTRGGVRVEIARTTLDGFTGPGPLVCVEGEACLGDGSPADTVTGADPSMVSLNVNFSEFADISSGTGSRPWFVWQPGFLRMESTANTYRDVSGSDFLYAGGVATQEGGLDSLRDRFIRHDADVATPGQTLIVKESFFIDSNLVLGDPAGTPTLTSVAVIDGNTSIVGQEYRIDELAVIGTNWPLPPVDALDGISGLHHIPGNAPTHSCIDCVDDLELLGMVSYLPALPAERVIPFPYETPSSPFTFGATSVGGMGVKWHLDPNGDGLPSAWVVFHASTAECLGRIDEVVDPDGDPDGDDVTNAEEYLQHTWPCVADTDGDGAMDTPGVDDTPLDPNGL